MHRFSSLVINLSPGIVNPGFIWHFILFDVITFSNNVGQTMLVTNNVGQGHHIRQFDHDIEEQHT